MSAISTAPSSNQPASTRLQNWVIAGFFLSLTFILWLPFGFNIPCYGDGIAMFAGAAQGNFIVWDLSRPFAYIAFWIGYVLDSNSFTGLNIELFVLLLFTGTLLYVILRQLHIPQVLAAAAGALAIVYPADIAIFYLGAINERLAVVFYLFAVYLWLIYAQTHDWYLVPLMWLSLAGSVGIYEAGYPLILLTPLLLWAFRPSIRSWVTSSLLWYFIPTVGLIRFIVLAQQNPASITYQATLLQSGVSIRDLIENFYNSYFMTLYAGWVRSSGHSATLLIVLAGATGVVTIGVFLWLTARTNNLTTPKPLKAAPIFWELGGLACIGLGFAAYLTTSLQTADRTLYYSSVGGSVCIAVGIWVLSRILPFKRLIFSLLIGAFVGLAMLRLLDLHTEYALRGSREMSIAEEIVKQIPGIKSGSAILVVDDSPTQYFQNIFPGSYYLDSIIDLAFKDYTLRAAICYPNRADNWGGFQENCIFKSDRVTISFAGVTFWESDYAHLLVLHVVADGSIAIQSSIDGYIQPPSTLNAYDPYRIIDPAAQLPPGVDTLIHVVPDMSK